MTREAHEGVMVSIHADQAGLAGAGCWVEIGAGRSIAELTTSVHAACDLVEDKQGNAVLVLWLASVPENTGWPGEVGIEEVTRWERALRRIERLGAATIAVAEGDCRGPASEALLVTDLRIVTYGFRLVLPAIDGLLWPGMAIYRLANHLGAARARQLMLSGFEISSARAWELGLVDEITGDETEAARRAMTVLGRVSGRELAIRRRLVLEAPSTSFEDALGAHLAACDRALRREQPTDRPCWSRYP